MNISGKAVSCSCFGRISQVVSLLRLGSWSLISHATACMRIIVSCTRTGTAMCTTEIIVSCTCASILGMTGDPRRPRIKACAVRPGVAGLLTDIECSRVMDSSWMYLTSFVTTRIGVELAAVQGNYPIVV